MDESVDVARPRGPRIRAVNIAGAVSAILIAALFLLSSLQAARASEDAAAASERFAAAEMAATALGQSSDALVTQARLYTVTKDPGYLRAYLAEAARGNREQALEAMAARLGGTEAYGYLEDALERSTKLMDRDLLAMALVLDATGGELEPGMEALEGSLRTAENIVIGAPEKLALAVELTHNDGHQAYDGAIEEDVSRSIESVRAESAAVQEASGAALARARAVQTALALLLVAAILLYGFLTSAYVVRPIEDGMRLLSDDEPLPLRGAYELQRLESAYNAMREQRKDRERLVAERMRAEAANRAKSAFLFNMSHDIRTPMNAIIGYTELAKRPGVPEAEMRGFLDKIDASSQHLLALINDVLEMSRIESGKMELEPGATDLVGAMGEVRDMFATQMEGKRIAYDVNAGQVADRWVMCDKNRLNRVLLNLVSNAYKFTPEGGSVNVTLDQVGGTGEAGEYELRVRDSGIGMSPEFAARVFDAFERERTSTVSGIQGTGLGMAITKSIVDLMGGTIRVETEQGEGTEFVVGLSFPLAAASGTPAAPDAAPDGARELDFSQMRVLLVEDNEINREIATLILEDAGFAVDTAEDGRAALDKVSASRPGDYDLVLMDIQMPVMNGYEATRAIRALDDPGLARVPIAAMTANAFAEDVKAAEDAGMDAHIAKPLDVAKMMETLAGLLR